MIKTKIYFNYGAMKSGKSLELLKIAFNYEEQGHECLILKPEIDTRLPNFIYSRIGLKREAIEIKQDNPEHVLNVLQNNYGGKIAVLVEEANFLSKESVDVIIDFAYENNISSVIFFGLKVDYQGLLFEGAKRIIERADKICESTSICWCGRKARQNALVIDKMMQKTGPNIIIEDGSRDIEYVTLCNYHYAKGQIRGE